MHNSFAMHGRGSVRGSASVRTQSSKPGKVVPGVRGSRLPSRASAANAVRPPTRRASFHAHPQEPASVRRTAPTVDEKDDYIVNLKGSIYLLSIENEMLKKAVNAPARGASGSPMALTRGAPAPTTAALTSSELPPAEYPSEIGDAFEMMRQKYTQVRAPRSTWRTPPPPSAAPLPSPPTGLHAHTLALAPVGLPAGAQVPA